MTAGQLTSGSSVGDGVALLARMIRRAGYESVLAAVAHHAVFLHPDTVAQTGGEALFPVARNMVMRGKFGELPDGRQAMFDDNTSPTNAYLWAARLARSEIRDVQFNHVWPASNDRDAYTALWNVCMTPAFLSKTTDGSNHPEVIAALRYRAYLLYGALPHDQVVPEKPEGFDELRWAPFPGAVTNLEATLRNRLRSSPKSRTVIGCRKIGWLYSGWEPDQSV